MQKKNQKKEMAHGTNFRGYQAQASKSLLAVYSNKMHLTPAIGCDHM